MFHDVYLHEDRLGASPIRHINTGFTLVEISIVMIIIGLLIGGTFGGMKLIENMQVNKTVQDLKSIESAAITFKDTYGRLPGDLTNPATRLPNCAGAPCATGGNGNRQLSPVTRNGIMANTEEGFAFWHHLMAADLLSVRAEPSLSLNFGEGQPEAPMGGGYRIVGGYAGSFSDPTAKPFQGTALFNTIEPVAGMTHPNSSATSCQMIEGADRKIDDGMAYDGFLIGWGCALTTGGGWGDKLAPYQPSSIGLIVYDLKGF